MIATKRHYERIIVACAFLLFFVNVGFTSTAFSVYQSYLADMPGVGNVGASFVVTVRTLVALLCMFFTDFYFKKIKPRYGFFIATLATCAAFALFGTSHSMLGLIVAAVLAGFGYGFGGMVAATYLIGNWFNGKVGSVSGIVTTGSGFAAIVVPFCAGWIIEEVSVSAAYFVEAAIALVAAVLLLAFVRMTPYEMGLEPLESLSGKPPKPKKKSERPPRHPKVKLATVPLPKATYVAMIIALVLLGGISVAGYNYFGILLTTQGIDPIVAASLISLAGVFLTISKFAAGVICDKYGTFFGSTLFFALLVIGLALCAAVGMGGVPEAVFAAIMLGIGMPLGTTGISLWSLELSSPAVMLKNVKRFQVSYALGGFLFNMMPGVLCQITGNYNSTYEVLVVLAIICAAMVLWIYAHHIIRARREYKKQHANTAENTL